MYVTDMNQTARELYRDLTGAFPHPFDWLGLLERPPFWKPGWRKAHRKVAQIFADHGFILHDRVALRYMTSDSQQWDEDAGGAIIRKLTHALDGQFVETKQLT